MRATTGSLTPSRESDILLLWAELRRLQAQSGGGGITKFTTALVSTAGGGGYSAGTAAAPYAIKNSDTIVRCYADSGATQVGVQLPNALAVGEQHTIWYFEWSNAGNPQPLISASGGAQMTAINPGALSTGQTVATQTVGTPYTWATLRWSGTLWMQIG